MKASKEKTITASRTTKRRLENPLTEAQKVKKVAAESERRRKIWRMADKKCDRLRAKAKRRCAAWVERLAAEVMRKSSRRKRHPPIDEEKSEKAGVEVERRSVIKLTVDQNFKKARVEATRRSSIKLTVEQKSKKARVEAKRRAGESSQAATIRLMDKRHSYATRSTTVEDRAIPNVIVVGRELTIVQPESDLVISFARTARASREVQSNAQQREAARGRAIKRRQQKLDDPFNIAEANRIGAPTCDLNAHLKYFIATGIDVWNGDPEHVIDVMPYFT